MKNLRKTLAYFTVTEWTLWLSSVCLITLSYLLFQGSTIAFIASLIGVTALIFNAKGNPLGQVLIIVFSVLYGIISWNEAYYGEMITYLGMSAPMAIIALIAWLKNPFEGKCAEVKTQRIQGKEVLFMFLLAVVVSVGFYFLLEFFGNNHLIPSTVSVFTSFVAAYLTFRRNPYFALAYAANDIVLILLWALTVGESIANLSVIVCFCAFLANDLYGFFSWLKMEKRQNS